ncbi:MAG: hypothetical protein LQ350_003777 [Teloschistes chrysophthalmus]|nr:MAG: hypothetical protein LQ350_003777 [Niorma chrysophthalma]
MKYPAVPVVFGISMGSTSAVKWVDRGSSAAVVKIDFDRQNAPNMVNGMSMNRQTAPVIETWDNQGTYYFANLSVGTPPQNIRLLLDTGSADMWINARNAPFCQPLGQGSCFGDTYDANASTTYRYIDSKFDITYNPQFYGRGDHASDIVHFGGHVLTDVEFGIGYDTTSHYGVVGLSYAIHEAHPGDPNFKPFSNFPQLMVDQGLIRTKAFSIFLNDRTANTGTILFGGLDTKKYHGVLRAAPIEKSNGEYFTFVIQVTGLGISGSGVSKSFNSSLPYKAWLDTGSPLTSLPDDLAHEIYAELGLQYDASGRIASFDCNLANSEQSIDFSFGPIKMSVPMHELVLPGSPKADGTPGCGFGIMPNGGGLILLGDTFLRSAYVVFDMNHNVIGLAQTNFDSKDSQIVEITG